MEGYKATIIKASKELSAIEKIKMKDMQDAIQLDDAVGEGDRFYLKPEVFAHVQIHNERSKNEKDYEKLIIIAADGQKYVTGSQSFFNSFMDIAEDMEDEETPWAVTVFRRPSKNYSGTYITCSITDVISE